MRNATNLISVLVSSSGEEVERIVEIEIVVTVEMTSNEIVDLLFRDLVKILEFVHRREFDDVQSVREYSICGQVHYQREWEVSEKEDEPGFRFRRCSAS